MASWFWLAILASALWSLTYIMDQYLLRSLGPMVIIFLTMLFICITLGVYFTYTHQWPNLYLNVTGNYKLIGTLLAYATCYLMASLLILKSINVGNASLAAIIESAYPLFTIPLAYFMLQEKQFNWGTILGEGLILGGLAIVQLTHKT